MTKAASGYIRKRMRRSNKLLTVRTMRRISFNRPKEKVRGAKRRFKALASWADSFEGYFPSERSNERCVDYKIPVLDRLVDPPTTKKEWQEQAVEAMFIALKKLSDAKRAEHSEVKLI